MYCNSHRLFLRARRTFSGQRQPRSASLGENAGPSELSSFGPPPPPPSPCPFVLLPSFSLFLHLHTQPSPPPDTYISLFFVLPILSFLSSLELPAIELFMRFQCPTCAIFSTRIPPFFSHPPLKTNPLPLFLFSYSFNRACLTSNPKLNVCSKTFCDLFFFFELVIRNFHWDTKIAVKFCVSTCSCCS